MSVLPTEFTVDCVPTPNRNLLTDMSRHLADTIPPHMQDYDPAACRPWVLHVQAVASYPPNHEVRILLPLPKRLPRREQWKVFLFAATVEEIAGIENEKLRALVLAAAEGLRATYGEKLLAHQKMVNYWVDLARGEGLLPPLAAGEESA